MSYLNLLPTKQFPPPSFLISISGPWFSKRQAETFQQSLWFLHPSPPSSTWCQFPGPKDSLMKICTDPPLSSHPIQISSFACFSYVCVACGLSLVVAHRCTCPTACGSLVPRPGIKPLSPALEGGFATTGPPGKSLVWLLTRASSLDSLLPLTFSWFMLHHSLPSPVNQRWLFPPCSLIAPPQAHSNLMTNSLLPLPLGCPRMLSPSEPWVILPVIWNGTWSLPLPQWKPHPTMQLHTDVNLREWNLNSRFQKS